MSIPLSKNVYLVKEHVGMFKAANNFDIYDPESQQIIMECREESLGFMTKLFRFTKYKRMTPFDIQIKTPDGQQVIRVKRAVSLFLSKVQVFDEKDQVIGMFKQKLFSLGGAFKVLDDQEREVCHLKGKFTGWDFKFLAGETLLAQVTKKWAGLGKELFTSADNYVLQICDTVPVENNHTRQLIVAAVMCIDMVLKE
ncbi:MAG: RNAase [Proteobacteria bacterium]|nr:RNAase [Pseudomonadota bacterium]